MQKRTMPICFSSKQYQYIVEYARKNGMVNTSQAIEKLLSNI
jgi:hypothetical protein